MLLLRGARYLRLGLPEFPDSDDEPQNSSQETQEATPVPPSPEDGDDQKENARGGAQERLFPVIGRSPYRGHASLHRVTIRGNWTSRKLGGDDLDARL